jgi:hypothetical protein
MKKGIKTIIIIIILLLVGVLAAVGIRTAKTYLSGASGGKEPQSVRVEADVKSATVTWQTEKEVQGTVEYGTTPASLLLRALENQPSTTHRVILSPLKESTTYYFRIRVGDEIFDNNGIPYSFKTKAAQVTPTQAVTPSPSPTEAPVATPTTASGETPSSTSSAETVTSCNKADFQEKFGTSDSSYDFDDNGTVNTKDWIECLNQNQ